MSAREMKNRILGALVFLLTATMLGTGASYGATLTVSGTAPTQQGSVSVCTYTSITESGAGNWAVTCGSGTRTISISPVLNGSVCDSYTSISQNGMGDWTVQGCSSLGPTITLDAPSQSGQTYPTSTAYTLRATATAPSGRTVSSVEFFADGSLIHAGSLSGGQYVWAWTPSAGTYLVLARVTDSAGAVADTGPRQMTFEPPAVSATIYYVHPDHLGTPRAITRSSDNQVVWRWDNSEPFGNSAPNENPSGLGSFAFNLRFPGQYYDVETGTSYNLNRDYDSRLGRYIQSDPIGLRGGLNTYGYVKGQPLMSIDPLGLDGVGGGGGGGGGGWPPPGYRPPGDDPNTCPLIGGIPLSSNLAGGITTWLCFYDCGRSCPPQEGDLQIRYQVQIGTPGIGCDLRIRRP